MLHDTSSDNSGDGSGVRFRVGLVVRFFVFCFFDLAIFVFVTQCLIVTRSFCIHLFVCLYSLFVCIA